MEFECSQCGQAVEDSPEIRFCQHCGADQSGAAQLPGPPDGASPESHDSADSQELPIFGDGGAEDVTVAPGSIPAPSTIPQGVGETVGPYLTTNWLGAGGMGQVWEAVEQKTGRRVALKRLSSAMADDQGSLKRFRLEANFAAKISHPNVTFIYGSGDFRGLPYIAMELMPGRTLDDAVRDQGPLTVQRAVDHLIDVIEGLQAIHEKGLIHRDIKPANCFLDADGTVKVGDFGLSKSIDHEDANLTRTGTFMGTPSYASPEQVRGETIDARTDQYSAAATLFFLLTGRTPFLGDATSMMAQILGDAPPSLRQLNRRIPPDLDAIVRKGLAKSRHDRFETLEHFKVALMPYASNFDSIADAGRRLAAFMIDQTLLKSVGLALTLATLGVAYALHGWPLPMELQGNYVLGLVGAMFLVTLAYYGILEGRLGQGVGKRLMGLRLTNLEGMRVGLPRAVLRAWLLPTGLGILVWFAAWQYRRGGLLIPGNPAEFLLVGLRSFAISLVPALICVSSMRISNRLLGLHGMLTGTRVVRAAAADKKTELPVADLSPRFVEVVEFGPYRSSRLLGETDLGEVYIAHDEVLHREVWILVTSNQQPPSAARMMLARSARQRWLDGGQVEPFGQQKRWDAYEAIQGISLQQMVCIEKADDCHQYAQRIGELAEELQEAIEDESLPCRLTLPQVWLDRNGHTKLLDSQIHRSVHASDLDSQMCLLSGQSRPIELSPEESAVELVQQTADLMRRGKRLPESLATFLNELCCREKSTATLEWAGRQASELAQRSTRLTWDIRLGLLAVTVGVEAIAYGMVAAVIMLVCCYASNVPLEMRVLLGVGFSSLLPFLMSAYFRGGLVFHLMGIRVCRKNGRPASAGVCGLRGVLSWFPFLTMIGGTTLLMIYAAAMQHPLDNEPGTIDEQMMENQSLAVSAVVMLVVSTLSMIAGILFAVFNPKRGLIDVMLRCRLMPR